MVDYYFIPLEKNQTGYYQKSNFDFDKGSSYKYDNYISIISKHFAPITSVVKLKTGKYKTNVYIPTDTKIQIFFCLVDNNNYPKEGYKIKMTETQIDSVIMEIRDKVYKSEGVFPENIIDIRSQFVTPFCKFDDDENLIYYNSSFFKNDTIVFGAPGSGKTTMLRMYTLDLLRNFIEHVDELDKLPIYIQLRNFNFYGETFENFINNSISNNFIKFNFSENDKYFTSGKLVLLLDGADEIDYEKFKTFADSINRYKERFPFISFVISSRPDKSFEKLNTFTKCWIQPFNEKQIKEFTYKKITGANSWENYISALQSVPEIFTLLQTPLLLSLSHFLYQSKSIIPINTGQLLKEFVNALVSTWDSQRNIERKLNAKAVNPNEIINTLGKLSLIFTEEKKSVINPSQYYDKFPYFDSEDGFIEFLKYIEFSTGIIKFNNDDIYFIHKSLQDYFCSNYLVERVQEINKKIFLEKDWSMILKMISGLSSEPNYLIKEMMSYDNINDEEKLNNTLAIFSETNNLSKKDLQLSFEFLENYLIKFEKINLNTSEIKNIKEKEFLVTSIEKIKGLKEFINLLKSIINIRFTKYEYDFNGYLKNSKSSLLKSIANINSEAGNIHIEIVDNNLVISNKQVLKGE